MRTLVASAALALLCAFAPSTTSAQNAPSAPAMPACDGVLSIVRLSEITPTGSIDKFMAAVAAHQAWYASHGLTDVIFAARVLERDTPTSAFAYSDKQVQTYHYSKPGGARPARDAAWDAYVKLYSETSTIKETVLSCVPIADAPASLK